MMSGMEKNRCKKIARSIPTGRYTGRARSAILLLAAAILFASCATAPKTASTGTKTVKSTSTKAQTPSGQLSGKVWLLAGYETDTLFVPLEPGHGSAGKIILKEDGTFEGTTGINSFAGTWKTGKTTADGYVPASFTVTKKSAKPAPNEIAAKFEKDLLGDLAGTRALKMEKDSFRLLDGQKRILLRFIFTNQE